MTLLRPWSADLVHGATRTRDLAAAGVSRHDVARSRLWRPYAQGLHVPVWDDDDDPDVRIARAAELVPKDGDGGGLGGWAAARLHGDLWADGFAADGRRLPVLVCMSRQVTCRRNGNGEARVWRSDLAGVVVVLRRGVPVTSLVRTAADRARLEPLEDAVIALDSLRQATDLEVRAVAEWCERHARRRGVDQALAALTLSRPGVKSPRETSMRLLWVVDAKLPEPIVNATVLHGEGEVLAEVDLLEPGAGLAGEYDGAQHLTARARSIDHSRRESMLHAGLPSVVLGNGDLSTNRGRSVHRLRRAWLEAAERDPALRRWYLPAA